MTGTVFELKMSLTTHNVNRLNSQDVAYVYYSLPDLSLIKSCTSQAQPLLNEVAVALNNAKAAIEKAYNERLAFEIQIEKLNAEKLEAAVTSGASIDKQEDIILKLTKELEEAKLLAASKQLDNTSDTTDELRDSQGENAKLKGSIEEYVLKLDQATQHFKTQTDQLASEAENARIAEAEIRDEIMQLEKANKELSELATKATQAVEETRKKVPFSSASSSISSTKPSAHLLEVQKLKDAFNRAMSINPCQRKQIKPPSEIVLDDENEDSEFSQNSHQFKIKMDSTLSPFNGNADSNVSEWLHATMRILDASSYTGQEKVLLASNFLKGLALQDYLIRERTIGKESWPSFINYMRSTYTPANHNLIIRERMKSLHQVTSVKDYYMEFRKLSIQTDDMTDATRLGMFLDNLKPELASHCYMNKAKTLDQAYDLALLKETYGKDKKIEPYVPTIYFSAKPTESFKSQASQDKKSNNYNNNNNSNYNRTNNYKQDSQLPLKQAKQRNQHSNEICCECNIRGHIGENCKKHLKCDTCSKTGHTAETCKQHLLCTKCNRRAHLAEDCYAKTRVAQSYMALTNENLDLIRWHAKVNEIENVEVALDSGGSRSVISNKLVKDWKLNVNKSNTLIETSSGDLSPAIGYTDFIEINFEGMISKVSFLITNIRTVDVLLGLDWFDQTGVILDPKNRSFMLPQREFKTIPKSVEPNYNNEDDLSFSLNMLCLENNEMEFVDDYFALDTEKTVEFDVSRMVPECQLSADHLTQFNKLMEINKDSFAISADQLGVCKDVKFTIETDTELPIHSVPYRQPPKIAKKLEDEVRALKKAGLIRDGTAGTWTSPAFIITHNGKERMVINYKALNARTKKFKFPLPRMDNQFDSFQGTKFFSVADLRKGFNQALMDETCKHKAGFITPIGIFEPNVLNFGLSNGPAFFSSVMQNIFSHLPFIRVYIDDLSIASKSEQEHLEHIEIFFKTLKEHNLKLNPEKCKWFATEIKLLGHIVDRNGIRMDMDKIKAIQERKPPTNVKQLQSFLGATNFYRKFILNYSKITACLHKLTSSQVKWIWSQECQEAFELLKKKFMEYPILRSPDFSLQFIVSTDASHTALGSTLSQACPETKLEYACYYASKLLKDSERAYGISELECLCILWALTTFRVYLYSDKFIIYTDNIALKWLLTLENPSGRLTRWSIMLSQFDFEIRYRPGKANGNADMLSRPVLLALSTNELSIELNSSKVLDPYEDTCLLYYLKNRRHVPGASKKKIKRIERTCRLYQLKEDGTIMARRNEEMSFSITIPKPEDRINLVLKEHELTHYHTRKIYDSLTAQNYYWKNMEKFIHDTISVCDICIRHDQIIKLDNPAVALNIDNIFERWGIDIVNGLPLTDEGYCSMLVVVEYLTKFAWAFPLKTKSAAEIAAHLTTLICTFGPPSCLLSDSGKEFLNIIVNQLCTRLKTH